METNKPEINSEYAKKLKLIRRQKSIHIGSMDDFKKRYGIR